MNKIVIPFVKCNDWLSLYGIGEVGWGNGYALLHARHPYFGRSYHDLDLNFSEELTYSDESKHLTEGYLGYWAIGFDTMHLGQNLSNCSEEVVRKKTDELCEIMFMTWLKYERKI